MMNETSNSSAAAQRAGEGASPARAQRANGLGNCMANGFKGQVAVAGVNAVNRVQGIAHEMMRFV